MLKQIFTFNNAWSLQRDSVSKNGIGRYLLAQKEQLRN
jgi:hypothetical protein